MGKQTGETDTAPRGDPMQDMGGGVRGRLFGLEDVPVELLLQPLVGVVDAQLLKRVMSS